MASLTDLIHDSSADLHAIAGHLEALSEADRVAALDVLGRRDQRALFGKADPKAIDMAHFVGDTAPLTSVEHQGRNTLPLPGKHRRFQKRFCRPEAGDDRLFGYNEAPSRGLIGPGFFVAIPTTGNADWCERGAVVVDYFQVPDAGVCPEWPEVIPNTKGLQRFVYHGTRDFMRKVSASVSIGAAYKSEKALDHYFTLCRLG
ncbi:MAG: hypothetical protein ACI8RZ_002313 [Myxococcota bacterium]|jgi:hypothetical protein